ncbi:hypothetical protein J0B03_05365 [Alkalibacter rhizosphaerae]|uniref:Uncharacterized protein n=1 Tax=Alkalibacter rhizosphaerae TaxID=2815577 RepID=A0A974XGL7_9FIRM|nr:hypothetical protein [Alkalibacter rhizosphaerae]QSX09494.1 hypothetical protein J0B03_05365 [Alkalibacter rhizosphaerae]
MYRRLKRKRGIIFLLSFLLIFWSLGSVWADELFDEKGDINMEVFERDWIKYSDFDDNIPLESRSYEVQQAIKLDNEIEKIGSEILYLELILEMERKSRLEEIEYKRALVSRHRGNIVKSLIRMAYFTYDTANSAADVAKSGAENILEATSNIQVLGEMIGLVDHFNPNDHTKSQKVIRTGGITLLSSGLDFEETAEAMVDEIIPDIKLSNEVDNVKLSEEDIDKLAAGHLKNRQLDISIAESYSVCSDMRKEVKKLETTMMSLFDEREKFNQAEKDRVYDMLKNSKKDQSNTNNGNTDKANLNPIEIFPAEVNVPELEGLGYEITKNDPDILNHDTLRASYEVNYSAIKEYPNSENIVEMKSNVRFAFVYINPNHESYDFDSSSDYDLKNAMSEIDIIESGYSGNNEKGFSQIEDSDTNQKINVKYVYQTYPQKPEYDYSRGVYLELDEPYVVYIYIGGGTYESEYATILGALQQYAETLKESIKESVTIK